MKILSLPEIKSILAKIDIISVIEQGFIAYSQNKCVIPPVGELLFANPPGDVHIKYGYIKGDEYYVVKIASGFYDNPKLGLSSSNGLMLIFSQITGELLAILLDEGHLTNLRTAAAGAIAAKYLAPKNVHAIGIVGTGIQAQLQLHYLQSVIDCRSVWVYGRSQAALSHYSQQFEDNDWDIKLTTNITDIPNYCNLIVTTTPSRHALLKAADIQPGTHITAVGADSPEKQELEAAILTQADWVIADSIAQCTTRGEIAHAIKKTTFAKEKIIELGNIIANGISPRQSNQQITVADLTGLAVQDIQIAKQVYTAAG